MIDMSMNQLGVDHLDMVTLEIPPFITESQLAMALYHMKVPPSSSPHPRAKSTRAASAISPWAGRSRSPRMAATR